MGPRMSNLWPVGRRVPGVSVGCAPDEGELKVKQQERSPTSHDRLIRDLFRRRMPGWQYVDTSLPLQTQRTDSYHGMCVSFVIDFFLHRLLNPNLTSLAVQHMMLRTPAQETRKRILRLNATVLDRIAESSESLSS